MAELDVLDRVFQALAHPARRQILLVLQARGERVRAGEIADRFACSWPTTTRHLGVLRDAGLVEVETAGRERFYVVNGERLRDIVGNWLGHFSASDP